MACGTCPDAVTFTLRNIVQQELDKVRAIKNKTNLFSRALQDIAALADDAINSALQAIPTIPTIDFTDILGYLTCPLTPLALALGDLSELTDLDPQTQLRRLMNLFKSTIDRARRNYEDALSAADTNQLIGLARKYANEFVRLRFDPVTFSQAILISATVFAVCGLDEYTEGPYLDFANEIQGFSLVGGLPADLDNNVAAIVQKLIGAEQVFKAQLQALTTLSV